MQLWDHLVLRTRDQKPSAEPEAAKNHKEAAEEQVPVVLVTQQRHLYLVKAETCLLAPRLLTSWSLANALWWCMARGKGVSNDKGAPLPHRRTHLKGVVYLHVRLRLDSRAVSIQNLHDLAAVSPVPPH